MPESLLVIGGASLDVLHFRGRTVRSAGGAGLYTALAAKRAGTRVTMVGPRPAPMPEELAAAAELVDWRGPEVPPERLPSFEIAHLGGGRTELRDASWRAEAELSVAALPAGLPAGIVYCIGLTDPRPQLELVRHFKALGRLTACGTYGGGVRAAPEVVRETFAAADVFFCNRSEATALFGGLDSARTAAGKLLFITMSAGGARVIQGEHATEVPAVPVEELDPTGAGDAFCGTVLALLGRGVHPVTAARRGVAAAAEMVTEVGPAALLRPPGTPRPEDRVGVDDGAVRRVAAAVGSLPEVAPFAFTGGSFPRPGHPGALDYFFAATLQQFGFWTAAAGRYSRPYIAPIDGHRLKGSDYLWAAYRRWLEDDPEGLTPEGQRRLEAASLAHRLRPDASGSSSREADGRSELPAGELPAGELRLRQARAYGRDLDELGWSPAQIVERANSRRRPLSAFLGRLDRVAGYKEDPLRKKSVLLALILRQRPEGFLRFGDGESVPPVVDYHVQRGCLRMGLVRVEDTALRQRLIDRKLLGGEDEWAVRAACFKAMTALQRASGRSMGAVDWFFFQSRRRCPEMTEPACRRCPVDAVCAHETALFQPVRRTTFY